MDKYRKKKAWCTGRAHTHKPHRGNDKEQTGAFDVSARSLLTFAGPYARSINKGCTQSFSMYKTHMRNSEISFKHVSHRMWWVYNILIAENVSERIEGEKTADSQTPPGSSSDQSSERSSINLHKQFNVICAFFLVYGKKENNPPLKSHSINKQQPDWKCRSTGKYFGANVRDQTFHFPKFHVNWRNLWKMPWLLQKKTFL